MEERLAKLERENRRLRVLSWTAFLSVALLFWMGQTTAPTVHDSLSVRELRLVDDSGATRARSECQLKRRVP